METNIHRGRESKKFLISDSHLGHMKLCEYKNRPLNFTELILDRLMDARKSGLILSDDTFYHLGDVCMGRDEYWNQALVSRIPCPKFLIRGNHDKKSEKKYIEYGWTGVFNDVTIGQLLLSHYPLPKSGRHSRNIHGHSHGDAHRDEEHCSFYDPEYHKDISPELMGYGVLNLKNL